MLEDFGNIFGSLPLKKTMTTILYIFNCPYIYVMIFIPINFPNADININIISKIEFYFAKIINFVFVHI